MCPLNTNPSIIGSIAFGTGEKNNMISLVINLLPKGLVEQVLW